MTICLTCTSSAEGCLTCNVGYYMFNASCLASCPDLYYPDAVSGSCEGCPFPCGNCSNYTFCSSCLPSYYLFADRCFSQCPINYYADNSSSCQGCNPNCQTCNSSACV